MKKQFLLLHILIFAFMQVAPAYAGDGSRNTEAGVEIAIPVGVPKGYRLPDMHLLDAATETFYYKLKDQVGKRIEVEGFVGRYGATFGESFREQIYKIESSYNTKVEVILTLTSTMDDAKILKSKMDSKDRQIVIVEIPDQVQKRLIEQAAAAAQGKLKEMYWSTKSTIKTLADPKEAIGNTVKIIKNQYVKPDKKDIKIGVASAIATGVIATASIIGVGVDSMTLSAMLMTLAMGTAKIMAFGGAATYSKTLANLMKTDFLNELKVLSGSRRFISEVFYGIGTNTLTSFNGSSIPVDQFLSESVTSGLAETAASSKTENIQSEKASNRMFWSLFAMSTAVNILGALGFTGPMLIDYGIVQLSSLQAGALTVLSSLYFALKYKAKVIEKFVEIDLNRVTKARNIKMAKIQRDFSKYIKKPTANTRVPSAAMCVRLFQ